MRNFRFFFLVVCYCVNGSISLLESTAAEPEKQDQAKVQYGLKFDGKDSYVTLPHVNFSEWDAFTIEAWVKDWSGRICCEGKQGDPENSLWISIRANRHSTGWESNNGKNYSAPVDPNSDAGWDHVALVFDGKEQLIYLNGKLIHQATAPKPGPFDPERKLFLGAQEKWEETQTKPAGLFGKGTMRMFQISKIARYSKEFEPAQSNKPDENTVVLFDFLKPDQTKLLDSSNNKQHGTIHSAQWVTVLTD
ncbi:MAG: LamG domain-containing protein [Planctomycetaceae bacterium]|nr:LamG domain-containing protein [Planctomycetaceae bacterium]